MAVKYWRGGNPLASKVLRVIPSNVEIGDVFTLTAAKGVVQASVSFTATGATVANVVTGLTTAWNASTNPLLVGVTATDATTHVTLTADVPGEDFNVSASAVDGAGDSADNIFVLTVTAGSNTAQVTQKNVASSANGETFIVTLAHEDGSTVAVLTHTVDGVDAGNATTVCAEIVSEFNALTHELAIGITASNSTSKLILTAEQAGIPFYATFGGTGTWDNTGVSNTANKGPNDLSTAENFSDGAVLASDDTLELDGRGTADILYGLNQSSITLARLTVKPSFEKRVGTSRFPLKISATLLEYCPPSAGGGAGPKYFAINAGSNQLTANVYATRPAGLYGLPPLVVAGTHASNALAVSGNSNVGLGVLTPNEATTFALLTNSGTGTVECGTNLTLTDVTQDGAGRTITRGAIGGTLNVVRGEHWAYGSGTIANVKAVGGRLYLNNRPSGSDAITNLRVFDGDVDARGDSRTLSINSTDRDPANTGRIFKTNSAQITFDDGFVDIGGSSGGFFIG
jgi:hypothetical protein